MRILHLFSWYSFDKSGKSRWSHNNGQVGQGGQGGLVVRRKRRIRILAPSYVKNFLAVSIFSNYINCATLVWWSNEGEVARVEATIWKDGGVDPREEVRDTSEHIRKSLFISQIIQKKQYGKLQKKPFNDPGPLGPLRNPPPPLCGLLGFYSKSKFEGFGRCQRALKQILQLKQTEKSVQQVVTTWSPGGHLQK